MRWPDVTEAMAQAATADVVLAGVYGSNIRMKGAQEHAVPGLEYTLVSDVETELWEPMVVQWDQYALTLDDLIASERALRALFSSDLATTIGAVAVYCEFLDGVNIEAPSGDNCYARAIRFAIEPLRSGLQRT
jgi:hypothetical protein